MLHVFDRYKEGEQFDSSSYLSCEVRRLTCISHLLFCVCLHYLTPGSELYFESQYLLSGETLKANKTT